jgi:tetratricopeptide (TPR) repeat protein
MWDDVSAATGQLARLESTRRTEMARKLDNMEGVYHLCRLLAAHGRKDEALKEFEKAMTLGSPSFRASLRAEGWMVRHQIYSLAGDFPRAQKELELERMRPMQVEGLRFVLAMGQLQPAEALKCPTAARYLATSSFHHLTFYLAWDLSGNRTEAEAALQRGIEVLKHGDADERRSAALLQATTPPTRAALGEIVTAPTSKALLSAALARKFPTERAWLAPFAARLNFDHDFPYHVIRQATESTAP